MISGKPKNFFKFLEERSAEIIGGENLKRALVSGKKLRVKLGVDPTNPDLHLGHVVPLRILRAFQDAGHKAVLIIGDFTAQIGDPSGRNQARKQLTANEVRGNEKRYYGEAGKILDIKRAEIRHNSEWLGKLKLSDFLKLLTNFSLKDVWEREDFKRRITAGWEVRLHEAMYQVLQAYDSLAVRADVELGGLDQKLNILAGRELQKKLGKGEQDIILAPYLLGLDGKKKMSKSVGNTIGLGDKPAEMFGKTMSIPDTAIVNYAEYAAWLSGEEVEKLQQRLAAGENPRDVKLDVAEAIVRLYYGGEKAASAKRDFLRVFSKKEAPANLLGTRISVGTHILVELLVEIKAAKSKSEARRLIRGSAVEVDGSVVPPGTNEIKVVRGSAIRVGKKKFFRID